MNQRLKVFLMGVALVTACVAGTETERRPERPETEPVQVGPTKVGKADGFDWGSGCEDGSGTFNQEIAKDAVVQVGPIPKDMMNVKITLRADEDVDIQLYDKNGTVVVGWPDGMLKGESEESVEYNGVTITWSGYNGDGTNLGHEFIKIEGVTKNEFVMKAYGYAAGTAKIDYSWEANPDCESSGSGSFTQEIPHDGVVEVGEIPKNLENVKIHLKSTVDIDIQLFHGSVKVVHWSHGLLKGPTKVTKSYQGVSITWSGYNGDGTGKGNEYIEIEGKTQCKFMMKVYGYEAGTATVNYSWGKETGGDSFSFFVFGDNRGSTTVFKTILGNMVAVDPKAIGIFNGGDITDHGWEEEWIEHNQLLAEGGGGKVRTDLTDWTPGKLRYIGVVGNHDTNQNVDWVGHWNKYLSGQKDLGQSGTYFKLSYKDTLFIVLDSDNYSAAQTAWLKSTLQSSEAQQAAWRFVFFHHPVYPCNPKAPWAEGIPWVRLFEQYKVDVAFVAHSHTYERTCPMKGGKCKDGGVIYVNSSSGGAPRRAFTPGKEATVGTDSYHCSPKAGEPGILEKGVGHWHHFCQVVVEGKKLTQRCYSHDKTTDPEDTLVVDKS